MDRFECFAEMVLDHPWNLEAIQQVVARFSGPRSSARTRLARAMVAHFQKRPTRTALVVFLKRNKLKLCGKLGWHQIESARQSDTEPTRMRGAIAAPFAGRLPAFPSVGAFADWCGQPVELVHWLSLHRKDHYRVSTTPKRSGGVRVLEAPRARLKSLQRHIATELLNGIPNHTSVHGFVRGRSAISYVLPHVGKNVVLRMDLQDFFPSIDASRVFGLFRALGYPHAVTQVLTDLCTAVCSEEKLEAVAKELFRFQSHRDIAGRLRMLYCRKHLPQGAPTSPSLANLVAYRMDCRLNGLAGNAGLSYTRYADDLLFSGTNEFGRFAKSFAIQVGSIALEEGFQVQFRKTRVMRASAQQLAAGIILNQRVNISRIEYDHLKAVLCNCVRYGPSTQNRDGVSNFQSHLRGKLEWVRQLNPVRGRKLTETFHSIDWSR